MTLMGEVLFYKKLVTDFYCMELVDSCLEASMAELSAWSSSTMLGAT
jgi:hypothetical protein